MVANLAQSSWHGPQGGLLEIASRIWPGLANTCLLSFVCTVFFKNLIFFIYIENGFDALILKIIF
jgi:hypothetical protein